MSRVQILRQGLPTLYDVHDPFVAHESRPHGMSYPNHSASLILPCDGRTGAS